MKTPLKSIISIRCDYYFLASEAKQNKICFYVYLQTIIYLIIWKINDSCLRVNRVGEKKKDANAEEEEAIKKRNERNHPNYQRRDGMGLFPYIGRENDIAMWCINTADDISRLRYVMNV